MIIAVCGGRNFGNIYSLIKKFPNSYREHSLWGRRKAEYDFIFQTLEYAAIEFSREYRIGENWLPTDMNIIAGGATGADKVAVDWAVTNYVPYDEFLPEWEKYGRLAGPVRNQEIIDVAKPQLVISFPGGKGTADMIRRARVAKIEVRRMTPQIMQSIGEQKC